jgi:hypothetical protein
MRNSTIILLIALLLLFSGSSIVVYSDNVDVEVTIQNVDGKNVTNSDHTASFLFGGGIGFLSIIFFLIAAIERTRGE